MNKTLIKKVNKDIECRYNLFCIGTKKHFEFYKNNILIKSVFATSYDAALSYLTLK